MFCYTSLNVIKMKGDVGWLWGISQSTFNKTGARLWRKIRLPALDIPKVRVTRVSQGRHKTLLQKPVKLF